MRLTSYTVVVKISASIIVSNRQTIAKVRFTNLIGMANDAND